MTFISVFISILRKFDQSFVKRHKKKSPGYPYQLYTYTFVINYLGKVPENFPLVFFSFHGHWLTRSIFWTKQIYHYKVKDVHFGFYANNMRNQVQGGGVTMTTVNLLTGTNRQVYVSCNHEKNGAFLLSRYISTRNQPITHATLMILRYNTMVNEHVWHIILFYIITLNNNVNVNFS